MLSFRATGLPCGGRNNRRRRADGSVHVVGARDVRKLPCALVRGDHTQTAGVPRLLGESGGHERVDDLLGDLVRREPRSDRDDLRVVVLTRQARQFRAVGECRPDAGHLVGGDLLPVAGAAQDDAERALVGSDGLGGPQHVDRVVVLRVVAVRAVVDDLVPGLAQVGEETLVEVVGRVVAADVDAHVRPCSGSGVGQSKMGPSVRLRLSSKKPGVPATSTQPSQSRAASSPFGAGVTTGPKNATPLTAMIGVPTSVPTRLIPRLWLRCRAGSNFLWWASLASAAGRPTSSSDSRMTWSKSLIRRRWMRVPMAS